MTTNMLISDKLILNEFQLDDIDMVSNLLNDPIFSELTCRIPFPYTREMAKNWITEHHKLRINKEEYIYAIRSLDNCLIGCISLLFDSSEKAELGYWVGRNYWNKGYATSAIKLILDNFQSIDIYASVYNHNNSSIKILKNLGFVNFEFPHSELNVTYYRLSR